MLIQFLKQQVFPGIYATYVNRQISLIYERQRKSEVDVSAIKGKEEEYILKLKEEIKIQFDRKVKIEDKAKSLLFIITLAITTITFSLNYLKENSNQLTPLIFIVLSIIYFVFGGLRALQTFNIKQFHVDQPTIDFQQNKFVLMPEKKTISHLKELIISKSLNDLINTKTSNLTYASFILIRNGLIMFVLFFISTISILHYESKTKNEIVSKCPAVKEIKKQ
ncbi:hypothetical protein [Flavobacterium sp. LAR06]|uniref:hypothetical protein n=1 Tax=Flavobacterium sp. LAR06 TaxID=3064897 RepID=UPI0035C1D08A